MGLNQCSESQDLPNRQAAIHSLAWKENCPGTFPADRIPYEKVAIMLVKNLKAFQTNTGITV